MKNFRFVLRKPYRGINIDKSQVSIQLLANEDILYYVRDFDKDIYLCSVRFICVLYEFNNPRNSSMVANVFLLPIFVVVVVSDMIIFYIYTVYIG